MTISYQLRKNNIVAEDDIYCGQVLQTDTIGPEQLADRIIDQGSTVTRPDILAVLENCSSAIESFLLEGIRIQLPGICDLFPRIKGNFTGPGDNFDPVRHKVDIAAVPGKTVRKSFRTLASVEKKEARHVRPALTTFFDLGTNTADRKISACNIGQINGYRLKCNPENIDEGIYLIDTTTGDETKITAVLNNTPSKLIFQTPDSMTGGDSYKIEVRTRYTPNGTLRTGRLDSQLEAT